MPTYLSAIQQAFGMDEFDEIACKLSDLIICAKDMRDTVPHCPRHFSMIVTDMCAGPLKGISDSSGYLSRSSFTVTSLGVRHRHFINNI